MIKRELLLGFSFSQICSLKTQIGLYKTNECVLYLKDVFFLKINQNCFKLVFFFKNTCGKIARAFSLFVSLQFHFFFFYFSQPGLRKKAFRTQVLITSMSEVALGK